MMLSFIKNIKIIFFATHFPSKSIYSLVYNISFKLVPFQLI